MTEYRVDKFLRLVEEGNSSSWKGESFRGKGEIVRS